MHIKAHFHCIVFSTLSVPIFGATQEDIYVAFYYNLGQPGRGHYGSFMGITPNHKVQLLTGPWTSV